MTLKLEGRITGPYAAELERAWHSLAPSLQGKALLIDLCGVTYVDPAGRDILTEIYKKTGAAFVADTPLTKYFAEEARRGHQVDGEEN